MLLLFFSSFCVYQLYYIITKIIETHLFRKPKSSQESKDMVMVEKVDKSFSKLDFLLIALFISILVSYKVYYNEYVEADLKKIDIRAHVNNTR